MKSISAKCNVVFTKSKSLLRFWIFVHRCFWWSIRICWTRENSLWGKASFRNEISRGIEEACEIEEKTIGFKLHGFLEFHVVVVGELISGFVLALMAKPIERKISKSLWREKRVVTVSGDELLEWSSGAAEEDGRRVVSEENFGVSVSGGKSRRTRKSIRK